jgi:hypothetical protein
MALNLIRKQDYKTYSGIKSTNNDAEIDLLIPRISQLVKSYCRRTFVDYVNSEKVEVFNGDCDEFILSESPVISVLGVQTSTDYGQNYVDLVEFVDWVQDGDYVLPLNTNSYWPKLVRGYQVNYLAGYETVPEDVTLAVMDLVTYYLKNDSAVHSNKAPATNGFNVEYISNATFPAHIKRVLDLYVADYK